MIEAADAVGAKHHSAFHRVFSTARWSLDEVGLIVFRLSLRWLGDGPVLLSIDDTLARKRGLKIFGVGMHHDPLISTRRLKLVNWGHSWVILSVMVRLPFRTEHPFCLPILFRLYLNHDAAKRARRSHRTRPQLAVQMLEVLCTRCRNRQFHAIGDSTYSGESFLGHLPQNCDLTGRLELDARLYEAPPVQRPGQNGRPRIRGLRLPSPQDMLRQRSRRVTLNIYGRRDRVRLVDRQARVHKVPGRALRIVAVEPLTGGRRSQAFFSTRHQASAQEVLTWYAMRWSIEETFHDAKSHLGFEQPQGWTRKAVERTAPTAMLLYSLIVLWFAAKGHRHYEIPNRPWYPTKSCASFADMLNTLRVESVREVVSELGLEGKGSRNIVKTLCLAVRHAA